MSSSRSPVLADFAERHGLTFVDSLREQVHNILTETGFSAGDHPVVALTEWPSAFSDELPYMTQLCERWAGLGLDATPLSSRSAGGARRTCVARRAGRRHHRAHLPHP